MYGFRSDFSGDGQEKLLLAAAPKVGDIGDGKNAL
jgi:hypothetical protein